MKPLPLSVLVLACAATVSSIVIGSSIGAAENDPLKLRGAILFTTVPCAALPGRWSRYEPAKGSYLVGADDAHQIGKPGGSSKQSIKLMEDNLPKDVTMPVVSNHWGEKNMTFHKGRLAYSAGDVNDRNSDVGLFYARSNAGERPPAALHAKSNGQAKPIDLTIEPRYFALNVCQRQ
jgi:hypothetical protein